MRKIIPPFIGLVLAILISGQMVYAQKNESKITVDITKEVNGKQERFEKTYQSKEEMEADEELKAFTQEDVQVMYHFNGPGHKTIQINQTDSSASYVFDVDTEINKAFNKMKRLNDLDDDSLSVVLNDKIRKLESMLANMEMDIVEEIEILKDMDWDEIKERHKIMLIDDQEEKAKIDPNDKESRKLTISNDAAEEFGQKGTVTADELLVIPELDYFPNPSSGRFRLRFEVEEPGPLNVKVYNIEGQEVYVRYFPRFSGRFSETIDLSGQTNGIYLLELTHNKKRLIRRVMIQ